MERTLDEALAEIRSLTDRLAVVEARAALTENPSRAEVDALEAVRADLAERVTRYENALTLIAAIPAFPPRDIAEKALGIRHEPPPRSTDDLRAERDARRAG